MMMLIVLKEFIVLMLLLSTPCGNAVPLSSFYPYGPDANDTSLPSTDDGSSPAITLPTPFLFYGTYYSTIYVNSDGDLSFGEPWSYDEEDFPISIPLVAVYHANVDTRGTGSVWYRYTQNTTLLAMVAGNISSISGKTFQPQWLFIATWDRVGYYPSMIDKTNTFQVILTTDGVKSYAIFLYADGLIQWPSYGAQVGFNAGDNVNYANIPGSRTPDILNIPSLSNVGVDGQWMFVISQDVPPCGVLYNFNERLLFANGFVKCYDQPYISATSISDLAACNDSQIVFVGAKSSSSSTLISIGAFGSSNVFSITRSTTTAYYDIGGAYWYRYPSKSFGFAKSSSVNLNNCDSLQDSDDCSHRLCWHLDQFDGGWRAGCVTWLNGDQTWRKVMYTGSRTLAICLTEINECAVGISGCNQICKNIIGSYRCSCYPGYQISSDNRTCVDSNECSLNISGCNQICNNTIGSYMCSCYPGYQISSDNRTCVDIDECALGISGCNQICTNTIGSYVCSCTLGYQISSNAKTCVDINECALGISGCSHMCNNTNGSYVCSCYTGYQLSMGNKNCSDIDECALGISGCEQTCNNTNGSFLCGCNRGYRLHSNLKNCIDVDECAEDISRCSHICNNTNGSYVCTCYPGYQPLSYDKKICVAIDYSSSAANSIASCASTIGISVAMFVLAIILCIVMIIISYNWLKRRQASNKSHKEENVHIVSMSKSMSMYEGPDIQLHHVTVPPPQEENTVLTNGYT